jgi:PP-loop superfamily ATP-utilizing enzyme
MIEQAEEFARSYGLVVFRVRYIAGPGGPPTAKLQVDPAEKEKVAPLGKELRKKIRAIGFQDLLIDPNGYAPPPQTNPANREREHLL